MIKELTKLSQNHISFGSCAPAPLWGVEYALSNNIEAQIESTLVQDENILIEGLEKGDYSLIVLHHPLQDKKYISQEFLNESLYLSVPPAHPLAPFKEISFSDLNGQSVLLLSRIGFWNEVCQRIILNHIFYSKTILLFLMNLPRCPLYLNLEVILQFK